MSIYAADVVVLSYNAVGCPYCPEFA